MRNASFLTFILKIYAHKIKINILLEVIKMVQDIVIEYYVTLRCLKAVKCDINCHLCFSYCIVKECCHLFEKV